MSIRVSDAKQPEQHHRAGRKDRSRSGYGVSEKREAGVLRVQLALELDVSIIVQPHADDPEDDVRAHEQPDQPHCERTRLRRVPEQERYGGRQRNYRNPLRRRVHVSEQNQLGGSADYSYGQRGQQEPADERQRGGFRRIRHRHKRSTLSQMDEAAIGFPAPSYERRSG